MDKIILQCTYCLQHFDWDRANQPKGIGYCWCRTADFLKSIDQNQLFRVIKEYPKPGHVIVMTDKGWQQLHKPNYREKSEGWLPYPVKLTK